MRSLYDAGRTLDGGMDDAARHEPDRDGLRGHARRLRWRLSGAWQLPAFALCTAAGTLLLHLLPIAGQRTGLVGAFLLCGLANIAVIAALAPAGGWLLRRRRRSLPKAIAADRAGAVLMLGLLALFALLGGLHHSAVVAAADADDRALAAARAYLQANAPAEYRAGGARVSVWKPADFLYRTCFPGSDPTKDLCLYVDVSADPPKVTRDPDQQPNAVIAGPDNPARRGR
jgi:hypothetical protein